MARTPPRSPSSDKRARRRKKRNQRGMKMRANRSPELSAADETLPEAAAEQAPPPPPATQVQSHWIRWGAVAGAAVVCAVAAGALVSVQVGLITGVAVLLGGAAFLVMLFPPPVHHEGGDPAGLNFGRTTPAESEESTSTPNRAARRRAERDSS